MTVIAYRDGIIAADRHCTTENVFAGNHTKVFSFGGAIFGAAGLSQDCQAFREWVEAGREIPVPTLDDEFDALLIETDGTVKRYGSKLIGFAVEGNYFAIGAGDEVAMGAMAMAATAEEAVRAACALVLGCGGGIDVLRLAPPANPQEASPAPASQVI